MKDIKQEADLLIEQHRLATPLFSVLHACIKHAIASTENTIKVLKRLYQEDEHNCLIDEIWEQTELLKELKSRL